MKIRGLTKKQLEEHDVETVTYEINGYTYKFENIDKSSGVPHGYCYKTKQWAWLYDTFIIDEKGVTHFAQRV